MKPTHFFFISFFRVRFVDAAALLIGGVKFHRVSIYFPVKSVCSTDIFQGRKTEEDGVRQGRKI